MIEMMQKAICLLNKNVLNDVRNQEVLDRRWNKTDSSNSGATLRDDEEAMTVGLLQDTDAHEEYDEVGDDFINSADADETLRGDLDQHDSPSNEQESEATESSSRIVAAPMGHFRTINSSALSTQPDGSSHNIDAPIKISGCDLHTMASLYLPGPFQVLFETVVCANFVFLLAAYALAGSRAYSEFLTDNSWYVFLILPFVAFFSVVIIFGFSIIQYLISFLTVIKGSLLLLVIVVVGIFSSEINAPHESNFQYFARPILLTTASLGGAFATVSLLFGRMKLTKLNVRVFTVSAISALVTCWILNVLWAWIVLRTVPQESDKGPSLHHAYQKGQISTQPVTEIILKRFPQYSFIISAISGFIVLSISVSYITMGAALYETVRGYAKTEIKSVLLFYFLIGLSYLIAQSSPSDFQVIMESMTSFCINLSSGVFIGIMLISSLRFKVKIPVSLGPRVVLFLGALFISSLFSVVCGFDFIYTILRNVKKDLPF